MGDTNVSVSLTPEDVPVVVSSEDSNLCIQDVSSTVCGLTQPDESTLNDEDVPKAVQHEVETLTSQIFQHLFHHRMDQLSAWKIFRLSVRVRHAMCQPTIFTRRVFRP
ncbi:hypothetical protein V6N13_075328 [Hibiscus sabdariffa]|uniref:Uncharacterized protein n=1 Tax=Hibiscus sabdariffa TaxID=183260 RepID=A0ABR2UBB2_9ROSI